VRAISIYFAKCLLFIHVVIVFQWDVWLAFISPARNGFYLCHFEIANDSCDSYWKFALFVDSLPIILYLVVFFIFLMSLHLKEK
jgi:hypothetical protein